MICMTNLVAFCLSATVVNFHVSGKAGELFRNGLGGVVFFFTQTMLKENSY